MKAQYVNPFAQGALDVMKQVLNVTPERGDISARPKLFTTQQINIVCGITGPVEGLVIYGMSMITADKIATRMIGTPVLTFDQLAASAIAELGNMVSGCAMSNLAVQGLACEITPPTIIRGTNVRISTLDVPAIVIPLKLADIGTVEVNVSLQERKKASVAA